MQPGCKIFQQIAIPPDSIWFDSTVSSSFIIVSSLI